jgi:hypothetical protein
MCFVEPIALAQERFLGRTVLPVCEFNHYVRPGVHLVEGGRNRYLDHLTTVCDLAVYFQLLVPDCWRVWPLFEAGGPLGGGGGAQPLPGSSDHCV